MKMLRIAYAYVAIMWEPMYQHDEGTTPWEKVGVDLCEYNGNMYPITVDYFSDFIEVAVLTNLSSKQGIMLHS